jgi:peptidoglycan hydrolase-like protein with peptidoglycan-binding domain
MTQNEAITKLISAGMTTEGACGFWGNVMAESGGKSNIAQRGMTKLSDDEYTVAADNGTINFAYDAVGYGLCQWTYYTRKLNLINYAKANGKSVGDMELQVDFAIKELQADYPKVWKYLTTATDIYQAASKVCTDYESPAVNNITVRANYALAAYNEHGTTTATETGEVFWPPRTICEGMTGDDVAVAQALLKARGDTDITIDGEFSTKLKNRVMVFQTYNGLAADGIIGALTWTELLRK